MTHPLHAASSRLAIALLLVALGLRALVPEGFMPAPGELVALCTEHGLQQMRVDPQTGEVLGEKGDATARTCPWSLLLTPLGPTALPPGTEVLAGDSATLPASRLPPPAMQQALVPPVRAPPRLG